MGEYAEKLWNSWKYFEKTLKRQEPKPISENCIGKFPEILVFPFLKNGVGKLYRGGEYQSEI